MASYLTLSLGMFDFLSVWLVSPTPLNSSHIFLSLPGSSVFPLLSQLYAVCSLLNQSEGGGEKCLQNPQTGDDPIKIPIPESSQYSTLPVHLNNTKTNLTQCTQRLSK